MTTNKSLLQFGEVEHEGASDMVSLSSDIKTFFQSVGVQPFSFERVELVSPSDMATWVPDSLYEEEKKAAYLNLLYGSIPLGSMVYADHSERLKAQCVFTADSGIVTAFKIALPGIVIRSQCAKLAESEPIAEGSPVIVMHLRGKRVDVVAGHSGQMLLSNVYEVADSKALLAVGVEVMQQLQIETPATTLWLCGEADRDTYKALCNYFPQVKLYSGRKYQFGNAQFQHLHTYQYVLNLI